MKIIEPKVELWQQGDNSKAHVARCARVCYGRETGNDEATIERLINDGHWSMFRHETYYMIANDSDKTLETIIINYANTIGFSYHYEKHVYYITVNGNWVLDHKTQFGYLSKYIVPIEDFRNTEIGFHMMRYTFCVDTQISTYRELNRVSPNSIAEKSTRYVYEDGSICRPHWLNGYDIFKDIASHYIVYKDRELDTDINHKVLTYIQSCDNSFTNYKYLVESGLHRQDARGVLPLDTATRCVYTYSLKEWRAIIDLCYYGTTGKPNPNAKLIAGMIRNNLMELGYDFRDCKLKHFHAEDYSGIYFTDELNAGEEFLYTTIGIKDDKEVTFLCKYIKNKHIEACPNCVFNNYFCYGLLCNIVVLKVVKDEEMRNNK